MQRSSLLHIRAVGLALVNTRRSPLAVHPNVVSNNIAVCNVFCFVPQTTKNFLRAMMARDSGHVVTVSSVAGLLGTHLCTDYSASKFAAVGFHESLFTELRVAGARGVHCTLVCPYYIDTGMFAGVRPSLLPMLRPSEVAERVVRAIERPEVLVVMPAAVRFLLPLKNWLPAEICWQVMYRVLRGPQAMATFRGRGDTAPTEPAAA